jgi:predicted CoA-binding protein
MNEPATIREMLGTTTNTNPRTIAVIGLSEDPTHP